MHCTNCGNHFSWLCGFSADSGQIIISHLNKLHHGYEPRANTAWNSGWSHLNMLPPSDASSRVNQSTVIVQSGECGRQRADVGEPIRPLRLRQIGEDMGIFCNICGYTHLPMYYRLCPNNHRVCLAVLCSSRRYRDENDRLMVQCPECRRYVEFPEEDCLGLNELALI